MNVTTERRERLAASRGTVQPRKLAHVVRRTSRFDELVRWYCTDPDGSGVELQVDTLPTREAIDQWLRSGEFAANPIGVLFDPEDLIARYESGEPLESLTARPPLPEGMGPFDMLRF